MTFIDAQHNAHLKILNNIMEQVGNTPMVRINRLGAQEGLSCEIVAKCEFFNAGGSVKDRIVKSMLEDAERRGVLAKGDRPTTIVEATSGNTGIALAMASAIKGHPCIIALPEKMSQEKVSLLKALGAKTYRTPTEAASSDPESNISVAARLASQLRGEGSPSSGGANPLAAFQPDQYTNPNNPKVHYEGTGQEIWDACGGKLDVVVMGAGTGGTISGVAKKLKELNPQILIVGVDPVGSMLGGAEEKGTLGRPYQVEGIGYDFVPNVLDMSLVDRWVKVNDRDAFQMTRRLIREEGLLCGGSSGAAMYGTLKIARELGLGPDKRIATILPDSLRNYMTKLLNDDWMLINGFIDPEDGMVGWDFGGHSSSTVHSLVESLRGMPIVSELTNGKEIVQMLTTESPFVGIREQVTREVIGVIVKSKLETLLLKEGPSVLERGARRLMQKEFKVISRQTSLKSAAALVATAYPVFVADPQADRLYALQAADLLNSLAK